MYKLILVDDEPEILSGMARGIPWNEWGFEVVGQAFDGLEALKLVEERCPHVVLSDIRMPHMDGVELMKQLNESHSDIKVIILSGYSDIEYLQTAIRNRVAEYLLKPTDVDEFAVTFAKIKEQLDEEQRKEEALEGLKQSVVENKEYQYSRILNDLIRGYVGEADYQILISELQLDFNHCFVAVFSMHSIFEKNQEKGEELELRRKIIRYGNLREMCGRAYYFADFSGQVTAVISLPFSGADAISQKEWKTVLIKYLQELQSEVQDLYGVELAAGVSGLCSQVSRLYNCYEQAVKCAHQKIFLGSLSIVLYPDLEAYGEDCHNVTGFGMERIKQLISDGESQKLQEQLHQVFEQFANRMLKDYSYLDRLVLECLYQVSRWALSTYQLRLEDLLESRDIQFFQVREKTTLQEKEEFLSRALIVMTQSIQENKENGRRISSLAQTVRDYVDTEYCSNMISLDMVADRVKKNAAYLSRLFKRETGYNFTDYVTTRRMEKSRELLRDPSLKIYEIAEQTGYADVSNFIKVFKKNNGISPNEYRNLNMIHTDNR